MAISTTREQFKERCLRRLGKPVIQINVADEQVEDIIDDALSYWWDYHADASEKMYMKYQVTEQDKINKYITIPENIIGVINIFDIGSAASTKGMFDIRYQIALNDLYQFTTESLVPYYTNMYRIRIYEEMLVGKQPIRYNRHINRLYIDMDWDKILTGEYLIVECYQVVEPDTYVDAWKDRWLLEYATALIKKQWGSNLTKYNGIPLMGGISFNGQQIYNEGKEDVMRLEAEMINSYSLPASDFIG